MKNTLNSQAPAPVLMSQSKNPRALTSMLDMSSILKAENEKLKIQNAKLREQLKSMDETIKALNEEKADKYEPT